jgi:hypothetical protein
MFSRKKVEKFLFEKKNQKTFVSLAVRVKQPRGAVAKVFLLLFFQKKKSLLPS